jgi:hypothetical protein
MQYHREILQYSTVDGGIARRDVGVFVFVVNDGRARRAITRGRSWRPRDTLFHITTRHQRPCLPSLLGYINLRLVCISIRFFV